MSLLAVAFIHERDAVIATGMESGARETYERLSELVATLST